MPNAPSEPVRPRPLTPAPIHAAPSGFAERPVAVAIPARNEADRIAACLRALAGQRGAPPPAVALLLNNCTDATASIVRALAPSLPFPIDLRCIDLPPASAHAGAARALAMQRAAALAGPAGVLLTTDADSVAPPDWIACNLTALARGVDAVTGRAVIDPAEARLIPDALHQADARECAYAALIDEIASLLDPDPADPWPRHAEDSGASIAVTVAAWRLVGGMRPAPVGEDRAFVDALRRHDLAIRHDPEVWVSVSGRIDGRAAGGMADTIRRRMTTLDLFLDDRLEPVRDAARRARLRRQGRAAFAGHAPAGTLARALALPEALVASFCQLPHLGAAWAALERHSSVLARRRVPVADLPQQTRQARLLRDRLRLDQTGLANAGGAADPADIAAAASA